MNNLLLELNTNTKHLVFNPKG